MRRGLPRVERYGAAAVLGCSLALLAFAGCGGGDDGTTAEPGTTTATGTSTAAAPAPAPPSGKSDPKLIREALNGVFASGDPVAACETYVTANYVATAYGDADGCKAAQTSGAAAKSIKVSGVQDAGGSAIATVVPSGGASSGEQIAVVMVKLGPTWRVDSATAPNAAVGP